jgi:hypothetical protein
MAGLKQLLGVPALTAPVLTLVNLTVSAPDCTKLVADKSDYRS